MTLTADGFFVHFWSLFLALNFLNSMCCCWGLLGQYEVYEALFDIRFALSNLPGCKHPKDSDIFHCIELVLDNEEEKVVERKRYPGENSIAMVAWKMTLKTPEYPDGELCFITLEILPFMHNPTLNKGSILSSDMSNACFFTTSQLLLTIF